METDLEDGLSKKPKYMAVSTTILMTVSLLMQPMFASYATNANGFPDYDNCSLLLDQPDDNITMQSSRYKNIVKTVHAEKELFSCFIAQTNFEMPVILDVTTYLEIYENIATHELVKASAYVVACQYIERDAAILGCESYVPSNDFAPVSNCTMLPVLNPMEMNQVKKGKILKTIEAEKKIYRCDFEGNLGITITKKVDIVAFTESFENLETLELTDVRVFAARCVALVNDNGPLGEIQDATVEACQFLSIPVQVAD